MSLHYFFSLILIFSTFMKASMFLSPTFTPSMPILPSTTNYGSKSHSILSFEEHLSEAEKESMELLLVSIEKRLSIVAEKKEKNCRPKTTVLLV